MTFTTAHLSVSMDGFVAGPDQSLDNPLGVGGPGVHTWHFQAGLPGHELDQGWLDRLLRPRGAYVMGRNMFGPVRGPWSSWPEDWRGWWEENPPYHAPVFVLTHHAREPLELEGGTTFYFVTDGLDAALAQAREAGDGDVDVSGGASAVRQVLAAGELDELTLDISPVLLGAGEQWFSPDLAAPGGPTFEVVEAEHSPLTTHVRYRITY